MRVKPKNITAALLWCDNYLESHEWTHYDGSFYIYFLRADDLVAFKLKFDL